MPVRVDILSKVPVDAIPQLYSFVGPHKRVYSLMQQRFGKLVAEIGMVEGMEGVRLGNGIKRMAMDGLEPSTSEL